MSKWLVQLKGELPGPFELSVVREDYECGRNSWGWSCEDKIVLFGTGMGENNLTKQTEENIAFAKWVANALCDVLNGIGEPQ